MALHFVIQLILPTPMVRRGDAILTLLKLANAMGGLSKLNALLMSFNTDYFIMRCKKVCK